MAASKQMPLASGACLPRVACSRPPNYFFDPSMDDGNDSGDETGSIAYGLHNAAEAGDHAFLGGTLLGSGASSLALRQLLRLKDMFGCTPLHVAVLKGQVQCVEVLLRAGASPDSRCDGTPALSLAVCHGLHPGKSQAALRMVELLLQHGAQPFDMDDGGRTALHWAAVAQLLPVVQLLLAVGVAAQQKHAAAVTAAAAAAALRPDSGGGGEAGGRGGGRDEEAALLPAQLPCLAEVQDADGNTALHLAARFSDPGAAPLVQFLLQPGQGWEPAALAKVGTPPHPTPPHPTPPHPTPPHPTPPHPTPPHPTPPHPTPPHPTPPHPTPPHPTPPHPTPPHPTPPHPTPPHPTPPHPTPPHPTPPHPTPPHPTPPHPTPPHPTPPHPTPPWAAWLAQQRNREGDAALHLAVRHNRPAAVHALLGLGRLLDRKQRGPTELARIRGHRALLAAITSARKATATNAADWATAIAAATSPATPPPQPSPTSISSLAAAGAPSAGAGGAAADRAAAAAGVAEASIGSDPGSPSSPAAASAGHASGSTLHSTSRAVPGGVLASLAPAAPATLLVLAPEECCLHHTAPQPWARGSPDPPPENPHRLAVLTSPAGSGVLHTLEFQALDWETRGLPDACLADLLRCHHWPYVRDMAAACAKIPDSPAAIGLLDPDTAISHHTFAAALKAAGACCAAVDRIMTRKARRVFCAVRPPGHHAGPQGVVPNANDPHVSHGFCLFSNLAIAAAYAVNVYRHQGVRRVALLDFDVHHGNGTEAVVSGTQPSLTRVPLSTPYSEGEQCFPVCKPWLDPASDADNIFFARWRRQGRQGGRAAGRQGRQGGRAAGRQGGTGVGYGPRPAGVGWFYPGSGMTGQTGLAALWPPAGCQARGPRIINVGVPGPGARRQLWRRAWRDKILPALVNFKPDMIFVSAGFDAHKK
ncbi:hypothetical protein QJQ45_025848, partial [Haematococcus lacustris]